MKYIGAWSISKLHTFETCKAQFKRRFIEKLPEPKSPALEHGSMVHKGIEAWFNGWVKGMPDYMKPMAKQFRALKRKSPITESMWGFKRSWEPLHDGFSRLAWIRAKTDAFLDVGKAIHIYDWKTGKPREISNDQMKFYGTLGLLRSPDAEEAVLELWYPEDNKIFPAKMERKDVAKAVKEFERRAKRLFAEYEWPEEPGLHCRWCPFSKTKGGPCTY